MATEYEPLECVECGADLLQTQSGNVAFVRKEGERHEVVDIYWACRNGCDASTRDSYKAGGCWTSWIAIDDLTILGQYVGWTIGVMRRMQRGLRFSEQAFEKLETVLRCVSQLVLRPQTQKEEQQSVHLRYLDEVRPEGL